MSCNGPKLDVLFYDSGLFHTLKESLATAMDISLAPLRTMDDFIMAQSRFQIPDTKNEEKWFNRIISNLLYYQTNYFLSWLIIFLLIFYAHPHNMIYGIITMGIVFGVSAYLQSTQPGVKDFKKKHPLIVTILVFTLGYFIIYQLGCVVVFLLGVMLPMAFTFVHASLRMRNLKNRAVNISEIFGVSRKTPMAYFLNTIGIEPDLKFHVQ